MKQIFTNNLLRTVMLLTTFVVGVSSAWAQTATIPTTPSTLTATGTNGTPIYRSSATSAFSFSKSRQLYTAAQIAVSGMTSGANVTSLGFRKSTAVTMGAGRTATLNIYMRNTSATVIPAGTIGDPIAMGFTLVYTNATYALPATIGFVPLTLASSFSYSGGGLEVFVDWAGNGAGSGLTTAGIPWFYTAAGNQAMGASNSVAVPSTTTGTLQARFYDIQFAYNTLPCTGTPAPGDTYASVAAACTGQPFTLTLQNATSGSGVTYDWQKRLSGATTWTSTGITTATYSATQSTDTEYQCVVTCAGNSGTSVPVEVRQNDFFGCYCSATATSTADEDIVRVAFGSMNNLSPCLGTVSNTYTDFRGSVLPPAIYQQVPTTLSVGIGLCGATQTFSSAAAVWIDYDHSGTFDASERVYAPAATTAGPHTETTTITIPLTALTGQTGMRVIAQESGIPAATAACTNITYGEVEDYLIDIQPPPCALINATAATAIDIASASANWTIATTPTSTATGQFYVEYSTSNNFGAGTGATAGAGTIAGPFSASALTGAITGLASLTTYYYVVRQACDGTNTTFTPNSNYISFTTIAATPPAACPATFTPANAATNVTRNPGGALTWNAIPNTTSYHLTFGTNAPDYDNISNDVDLGNVTSYTLGTLLGSTTYGWKVVPYNAYGNATGCTFNTFTSAASLTYCTATATLTADEDIVRVKLGTLNNSSSSCPTGALYTDFRTSVAPGVVYKQVPAPLEVQIGTCGTGNFTNHISVWIDYNQNGIFEGSEQVYTNTATSLSTYTASSTLTVPATALTGLTVMRVLNTEGTAPLPTGACTNATYGEVEDYTINILPTPCAVITAAAATTVTDQAATANWSVAVSPVSTAVGDFYVEYGTPGFTPGTGVTAGGGTLIGPLSAATLSTTITGLTQTTTYQYVVRQACDVAGTSFTFNSNAINFTTVLPVAPVCATGFAPATGTTGVSRSGGTVLSWATTPNASGYRITLGTNAPAYDNMLNNSDLGNVLSYTIAAGLGASTTYGWTIVPYNGIGAATGCTANTFTSAATFTYCVPTQSGSGYITNIALNTLNNTTLATGNVSPYYTIYPATGTNTTNLVIGNTYALSLTTDVSAITSVWIDYNQNGLFEASEWVQPFITGTSGTLNITIPGAALPGSTGMRVRSRLTGNTNGSGDACASFGSGETEDYIVTMIPAPAAPTAITEAPSPSCTSGGSLSVAAAPAGITYYWQGTTALGTDQSLNATTPFPIATNGTYYVRAYDATYMIWSLTSTSITVTDFPTGPAAPAITGTSPACNTANLTVGTAPSGVTYYWQGTNPVGTSTTQVADDGTTNTPYTVTTSGTYFVSAKDNTTGCWSNTPSSLAMTILATPTGTVAATQISSCAGGGGVSATVTNAVGSYTNDFSSATLTGATLYSTGTPGASIAGGVCTLTTNTASQAGSLVVNNAGAINSNAMTVDFDLTIGNGADGFSYSFGDNITLGTTGNPEHGSGSKLRVGFDTYGASPDAQGIYLQYGATVTSGLTAATPGVLAYSTNNSFINTTSHITISVDNTGLATVSINGTPVAGMNGVSLGAGYTAANKSAWKHAFAARTGGISAVHQIDNLAIQYSANPYEYSLDGTTWQTSSSFTGLVPNTYTVQVRHTSLPTCVATLAPVVITPLASAFTTTTTAAAVCSTTSFTLGFTPNIAGATYQWQSSPDGMAWTNIATATAATYTTTQAAATYYQCIVNCGTAIASSPLQVTMSPFTSCYCSSIPSNTADEEIYSVTIGSSTTPAAYVNGCTTVAPGPGSILNRYSNFTTLGSFVTLPQTIATPVTIVENECDGATYFTNGCAIFIDLNQDGDYLDAGEKVFSDGGTTLISPRNILGNITIPATALLGTTGMRIIVAESNSGDVITPCMTYTYGETEDYLVTIVAAPACAGTPTVGTATATTTTICGSGTSTLSVPPISELGITYQWLSSPTAGGPYTNIATATSSSFALPTQTIAGTTYYACSVTCANGGSPVLSNELIIDVKAAATVSPAAPVICSNVGGTLLTASPATGATYQWSANAGSVTTQTYTATAAGAYSVIVTQGTCITTATANVTVNAAPTVTATAAPTPICEGGTFTVASSGVAVQPGYAVSSIPYTPNTTATYTTLVTGGVATPAVTSGTLDDGYWSAIPLGFTFNYYGTDYTTLHISTNGNVQFGAAPSTAYTAQLLPNATVPNNIIAAAWMDITFSASGTLKYTSTGTAPNRKFIVDWNGPVFSGTDNAIAQLVLNETTNTADVHFQQFTNNVPKVFTIGVENAAGTAATAAPGRNQVSVSTTADEAWRFSPNSLTYAWTGANTFTSAVQNPAAFTNAAVATGGAYTVTATDMFGCTATSSASVVVNAKPVPAVTGALAFCAGSSTTLTAGGGATYQWTGGPATDVNTISAGGTYTVAVTSAANCTASTSVIVMENALPVAGLAKSSDLGCAVSSVTLTASGGAEYDFGTGLGFTTTATSAVTTGGTYTVTVKNAAGCTSTSSITVVTNVAPVAGLSKSGNVSCAVPSATLTATGGTEYDFGTGAGFSATDTRVVSAAGTYTVIVRNAGGCTATATIVVTGSTTVPSANVMGNLAFCTGGSTTLLASPGFATYTWSGGTAGTSANRRVFNAAGTYSVVVTASNGCATTKTFTVAMNSKPVLSGASIPTVCAGSTLMGSVTVTSPITATTTWTSASGVVATGTNLNIPTATTAMSGLYVIRSTNTCGTTSVGTNAVVKAILPITVSINNANTLGGNTGSISVTAPAGSTFSWAGSSVITGVRTGLAAGSYMVTVTPPAGNTTYCANIRTIVIQ